MNEIFKCFSEIDDELLCMVIEREEKYHRRKKALRMTGIIGITTAASLAAAACLALSLGIDKFFDFGERTAPPVIIENPVENAVPALSEVSVMTEGRALSALSKYSYDELTEAWGEPELPRGSPDILSGLWRADGREIYIGFYENDRTVRSVSIKEINPRTEHTENTAETTVPSEEPDETPRRSDEAARLEKTLGTLKGKLSADYPDREIRCGVIDYDRDGIDEFFAVFMNGDAYYRGYNDIIFYSIDDDLNISTLFSTTGFAGSDTTRFCYDYISQRFLIYSDNSYVDHESDSKVETVNEAGELVTLFEVVTGYVRELGGTTGLEYYVNSEKVTEDEYFKAYSDFVASVGHNGAMYDLPYLLDGTTYRCGYANISMLDTDAFDIYLSYRTDKFDGIKKRIESSVSPSVGEPVTIRAEKLLDYNDILAQLDERLGTETERAVSWCECITADEADYICLVEYGFAESSVLPPAVSNDYGPQKTRGRKGCRILPVYVKDGRIIRIEPEIQINERAIIGDERDIFLSSSGDWILRYEILSGKTEKIHLGWQSELFDLSDDYLLFGDQRCFLYDRRRKETVTATELAYSGNETKFPRIMGETVEYNVGEDYYVYDITTGETREADRFLYITENTIENERWQIAPTNSTDLTEHRFLTVKDKQSGSEKTYDLYGLPEEFFDSYKRTTLFLMNDIIVYDRLVLDPYGYLKKCVLDLEAGEMSLLNIEGLNDVKSVDLFCRGGQYLISRDGLYRFVYDG